MIKKILSSKPKLMLALIGILAAGGLTTSAVFAAIPDTSGTIHACYKNEHGEMRVIDNASQNCKHDETGISWSTGGGGGVLVSNTTNADFQGAVMVGWDLSNKDFTGTTFMNANLRSADLRGSQLTGTGNNFYLVNFSSADLSGQDLSGFNLQFTQFAHTKLAGAKFINANLGYASLLSGDFSGLDLTGANLAYVDGGGLASNGQPATFAGANLTNVTFAGAQPNDPTVTELTHVDFTGANLTGVQWGANTNCPDGTNSGSHGNTCEGHLTF